jgi:hypothetical protein
MFRVRRLRPVACVNEEDYSFFINSLFVRDRSRVSKGVIEVIL